MLTLTDRLAGVILIVDDDEFERELISTLLDEAGFDTLATDTAEAALAAVRDHAPALAVLDVDLPRMCGYELCRALRERFGPSLPIVFVSGTCVESYDRVAGLLLGANDFVTKPFAPDEFVARVRGLLDRERRERGADRAVGGSLTRREREVLALLADGLTQPQMAERLCISPKTVGAHVERILDKLSARNRAHAVAIGYRNGLIDQPAAIGAAR